MRAFAELLDRLVFTSSRNAKLRLMGDYFRHQPDPQRGYALAALTGALDFRSAKAGQVRDLVATRVDPVLFGWSYDYVGDLAETVALIWPARHGANRPPDIAEVVGELERAHRKRVPDLIERWLDALDPTERWALLKLITGGLRVGVSQRLAKTALAEAFGADLTDIEEVWHGLSPPYEELFAWLEGRREKPIIDARAAFRPLMLANPLADEEVERLDVEAYRAEWKWDGIRVQIVAGNGNRRLFSRTGEDITNTFPEIAEAMDFDAVLDGELLVVRDGEVASFNDLQQRLNRKTVTQKMLRDSPAHVRLYDILFEREEDLRPLGFDDRRARLERWHARARPARMDLSELLPVAALDDLRQLREEARQRGIEGLMLKRADSAYVAGRPKGPWYKWKRDPLSVDAVLMYAQRGHGKRSSFFSDYTFGTWRPDRENGGWELVPVGKAYFGFTDVELRRLDKWVRDHTVDRFGPVRAVSPELVLEIAFDAVHPSTRHKSGVAMRFPRVSRIRWDKPASEADLLETLEAMVER
ncbi:cisplatin damage response ATP-dependent DNA ligase [Ferruginivarius sediminum]|uniref:DNA ligase (ATP) n=1 Tax=Ferruginivarius sediminum TaxID=2661937 RepID=A0A369THL6_9PROT|nr:cisplatin damage response ATP-dependent DNA ligase [Ferruginivarius sediminum]RDD62396.1 cisplatin damage response ATP-dependent DNA ligase [Ferruginivarius sediminum]